MKSITSKEFHEEIQGRVVVQFSATWCGPCKVLSKTISTNCDNLDTRYVKIDLDNNADLATEYGVRAVPTLILFESGKEVKRTAGNKSFDQLQEFTS